MNQQLQTMINNMPEKTGKSLEQWNQLLSQSGLEKHGEIMKLLKDEHDVSHGFANTISILFREQLAGGPPAADDLVSEQYKNKAHFLPIYQNLVERILSWGSDITIAPKKTYVSLVRNKQFAIIKPSTMKRMDIGLNLKGEGFTSRLETDKVFGGMCSHRVQVVDKSDIDDQLLGWIKQAYERS